MYENIYAWQAFPNRRTIKLFKPSMPKNLYLFRLCLRTRYSVNSIWLRPTYHCNPNSGTLATKLHYNTIYYRVVILNALCRMQVESRTNFRARVCVHSYTRPYKVHLALHILLPSYNALFIGRELLMVSSKPASRCVQRRSWKIMAWWILTIVQPKSVLY